MHTEENTVAVVDYGMGNLRSVAQALRAAGGAHWQVTVTSSPEAVRAAARVVLPGQGAMPECMRQLHASGLREAVLHACAHKPLLGICVGMQMLLERSAEGHTPCLGLMAGSVEKFAFAPAAAQHQAGSAATAVGAACPNALKLPHMGWNRVHPTQPHPLWEGIAAGTFFYFVHSFYAQVPQRAHVAAEADYGGHFACAIARDNLFATQFHPEKSADQGLRLLRNFLHWQAKRAGKV